MSREDINPEIPAGNLPQSPAHADVGEKAIRHASHLSVTGPHAAPRLRGPRAGANEPRNAFAKRAEGARLEAHSHGAIDFENLHLRSPMKG
jgi:hypothetical protein